MNKNKAYKTYFKMSNLVCSQVSDVDKLVEDEGSVRMGVGLTIGEHVAAGPEFFGEIPF